MKHVSMTPLNTDTKACSVGVLINLVPLEDKVSMPLEGKGKVVPVLNN